MMQTFVDGDFPVGKGTCSYYCCPSCHPAQVGPKTVYGCTNPIWYANRTGDFCPIVRCKGNKKNCELRNPNYNKMIGSYTGGKRRSITSMRNKADAIEKKLNEAVGVLK